MGRHRTAGAGSGSSRTPLIHPAPFRAPGPAGGVHVDPGFVREAARLFPGRIAVGIDARDGWVAVEGWAKTSNISALGLGRRFEHAGVAAIVYTDISRDGALAGLNIASTVALADALSIPVIASGGLASIEDVKRLTEPDCARIAGAVAGRALYDGRLDPREAFTGKPTRFPGRQKPSQFRGTLRPALDRPREDRSGSDHTRHDAQRNPRRRAREARQFLRRPKGHARSSPFRARRRGRPPPASPRA